MEWTMMPSDETIQKTVEALTGNGFAVYVAQNGQEAKHKVLEMIPAGAEVMTMTSVTLDTLGISKELNGSGRYDPVRKKFAAMDPKTQGKEMRKLGGVPDWAIGSVHAVTQDGHLLVASQGGSQLPAYVYGASRVVWVVGCQKIVANTQDGIKRVYEHSLPLENERAMRVYGKGSAVNNLLILNSQKPHPGRCAIILVKEKIGF